MIKKFNQFVNSINEEFVGRDILAGEGSPSEAPSRPSREVETDPGRPSVNPGQRPSRPSVVPSKRPGVEPAPLAEFEEEEEAPGYIGDVKMKELADKLGVDYNGNSIEYNGKIVNFFSETEKFHVDKKKFETADEVVSYLEGDDNLDIQRPEYKLKDEDRLDPEFEAKSYKFTRRNRLK